MMRDEIWDEVLRKYAPDPERYYKRMNMTKKLIPVETLRKWEIPEVAIVGIEGLGDWIEKDQNPNQRITAEELSKDYDDCLRLGVSALHPHARDEEGVPANYDTFKVRDFMHRVIDPLRKKYGRSFVVEGGIGYYGKTFEDNLWPIQERFFEVVYQHPLMGQIGDFVTSWSPKADPQAFSEYCERNGVKVAIDVHDTSHIENAKKWLIDTGILSKPTFWHILGHLSAGFIYMPNQKALIEGLLFMAERIKEIDRDAVIYVSMSGRGSIFNVALALMLGFHVRVGMEDTIWRYPHRDEILRSNLEVAQDVLQIAGLLGRRPATGDEYRKIVGIK